MSIQHEWVGLIASLAIMVLVFKFLRVSMLGTAKAEPDPCVSHVVQARACGGSAPSVNSVQPFVLPPPIVVEPEEMKVIPISSDADKKGAVLTGTLLLRERRSRNSVVACLIVWFKGGRRRRGEDLRSVKVWKDSLLTAGVVEEAANLAKALLNELQFPAPRRRVAVVESGQQGVMEGVAEGGFLPVVDPVQVSHEEVEALPPQADTAAPAETPLVASAPSGQLPDGVELLKMPVIYCGIVNEAGMSKKPNGNGFVDVFCVELGTQEGTQQVWGSDLRRALQEAKAGVGDDVRIEKYARKSISPDKAPQSLYRISKLETVPA